MVVIVLLISVVLLGATGWVLRPVLVRGTGAAFGGLDGIAVVSAFGGFVLLAAGFGPLFALALGGALILHEFGQVMAYRLAGHDDAHFRLFAPARGVRISAARPASDGAAVFIALMGPGVSLAPMIAALALAALLREHAPAVSEFLHLLALAIGAVNFVALLPLWPFPGGRILRGVVRAWFPARGPLSAAFMCAVLMGASLTLGSVLLFLVALAGALALVFEGKTAPRPALRARELQLAFTAYLAQLGAFFTTGWWVLRLLAAG